MIGCFIRYFAKRGQQQDSDDFDIAFQLTQIRYMEEREQKQKELIDKLFKEI